MINHNEESIEKALGVRDSLQAEIKSSLLSFLKQEKENNSIELKKTHLIEYIINDVNIQGEYEMFFVGKIVQEMEMMADIKETIDELVNKNVKRKLVFNEEEFINYINDGKDDL